MKKIVLLILLLFSCSILFAQQLLNMDPRTINVDQLSDNEIMYYYNKLQQNHVSLDQAEQIAAAKGMPQDQIQKLHDRIQSLLLSNNRNSNNNNQSQALNQNLPLSQNDSSFADRLLNNQDSLQMQDEAYEKNIFGSDLFSKSSLSFQPNLRIATPANYQLGPDDEIDVDVFGYSEAHYKLPVSSEGNIYIPNVGPVYVSGLTIEDASLKIKTKLAATIYKAINSGKTGVQVSLGNIKSVRVTVIGEAKKPGTYTVSSLSTVFNALYLCGGPAKNGSYRNVELVRNNKVIRKIDLYSFLLQGNQADNIGLMDGDVINIPFYTIRVTVNGEVKRPAIYELVQGITLQQVLEYAGGFSDSAYTSDVKITQFTDREKRVQDIGGKDFGVYLPHSGDVIEVGQILQRYENRVEINGAVMRPGDYELTQGLTLKQLIVKADGLREDAFVQRGIITRLKDDLSQQLLSFDVMKVLNGAADDIILKKEDVVQISSIFDLRDSMKVNVQGEVRTPGLYDFKDSMSLKDLIFEAGGFTEAATAKRIEIARRVTDANVTDNSTQIAEIIQVDSEKDLLLNDKKYALHPFDLIIVRNNPGYFTQKSVAVTGEVMYPGQYIINSTDEKVSNLIERAGGFKSTADPSAASLKRQNLQSDITALKTEKIAKLADVNRDQNSVADADSLSKEAVTPYDLIGINLNEIIKQPGSTNDLILETGDILNVPKKNQAVKVRGEVLYPTQFAFQADKNMKHYINKAGGYASNALKRKSFVISSNGNARKIKTFLFFKSYPDIYAGDEIYVPSKPDRGNRLSTAEVVGISSALASLASVIVILVNNLK